MPAGCAITGSTRAATGATGSATSSGSSPRPRVRPDRRRTSGPADGPRAAAAPPPTARIDRPTRARRPTDPERAPPTGRTSRPSAALGRIAAEPETLDEVLREAILIVRQRGGFQSTADLRAPRRALRPARAPPRPTACRTCRARTARSGRVDRAAAGDPGRSRATAYGGFGDAASRQPEIAIAIPGDERAVGRPRVLADPDGDRHGRSIRTCSSRSPRSVGVDRRLGPARRRGRPPPPSRRRPAPGRRRDIGSRLDLDRILSGLVDHAMVLFNGDRAAVFLRGPDGRATAEVSRGLSQRYLQSVVDFPSRVAAGARRRRRAGRCSRPTTATTRGPATSGRRSSRRGSTRSARAPLFDGDELLGLLNVYHDRPHEWTADELDTMAALADQAAIAIKNAQNFAKMATWAAQLQSIQQLGARLSRLGDEREIGVAIATELRQLIDYHNVRVYRLRGDDLVPVAMQRPGRRVRRRDASSSSRSSSARGSPAGSPSTAIAQNLPDADADPRANTIPGTEEELDESMLLAPMTLRGPGPRRRSSSRSSASTSSARTTSGCS